MAVFLRAIVMLLVLVGLPAAWVYYGPLPPQAQGIVDRVVEVAKSSIGWEPSTPPETSPISAPHFDPAVTPAVAIKPVEVPQPVAPTLEAKLSPLLQQLRELGATEYALEKWGNEGQLYRFRCAMPLKQSDQLTQHFEATQAQAAESIQQVLAEVSAWQTARRSHSPYK